MCEVKDPDQNIPVTMSLSPDSRDPRGTDALSPDDISTASISLKTKRIFVLSETTKIPVSRMLNFRSYIGQIIEIFPPEALRHHLESLNSQDIQ